MGEIRPLTDREVRFAELYVEGECAGNATECAMRVYDCKSRDSARALGSQVLARPAVAEYLSLLRLRRRVSVAQRAKPFEELLPEARALQEDAIRAGREALREIERGAEPSPARVGLVRAGLEAAELAHHYALGKPIHRTEQGTPGEFEHRELSELLHEAREYVAALRELGIDLLGAGPYDAVPTDAPLPPGTAEPDAQETAESERS